MASNYRCEETGCDECRLCSCLKDHRAMHCEVGCDQCENGKWECTCGGVNETASAEDLLQLRDMFKDLKFVEEINGERIIINVIEPFDVCPLSMLKQIGNQPMQIPKHDAVHVNDVVRSTIYLADYVQGYDIDITCNKHFDCGTCKMHEGTNLKVLSREFGLFKYGQKEIQFINVTLKIICRNKHAAMTGFSVIYDSISRPKVTMKVRVIDAPEKIATQKGECSKLTLTSGFQNYVCTKVLDDTRHCKTIRLLLDGSDFIGFDVERYALKPIIVIISVMSKGVLYVYLYDVVDRLHSDVKELLSISGLTVCGFDVAMDVRTIEDAFNFKSRCRSIDLGSVSGYLGGSYSLEEVGKLLGVTYHKSNHFDWSRDDFQNNSYIEYCVKDGYVSIAGLRILLSRSSPDRKV